MKLKETLEKYNLKIKKSFGQNFLINKGILEIIVKSAQIKKTNTIIEIGPGLGFLTEKLLEKAKNVICIEKDKTLIPVLKDKFLNNKKLKIINEDALKYKIREKKYKIVANIPYYISSPLIKHFLNQKYKAEKIILLTQKEFAERVCDEKNLSILALEIKLFAETKILKTVSKNSFFPAPKVNSSILEIRPFQSDKYSKTDTKKALEIAKKTFIHKRKLFFKSLQKEYNFSNQDIQTIITKSEINEKIRPEKLKIKDLIEISKIIESISPLVHL